MISKGLITKEDLSQALKEQKINGKLLGTILVEKELISKEKLSEILESQRKIETISLSRLKKISPSVVGLIPERLAQHFALLVIDKRDNVLTLAMANPTDIIAIDVVTRITGCEVKVIKASPEDVLEAIEKYYGEGGDLEGSVAALSTIEVEKVEEEKVDLTRLKLSAEDAPIVRFVNSLFFQAVERRTSDIHLEPREREVAIRLRIDGVLHSFSPPPKGAFPGIVSRIKILSNLDIGEKRLPQDGRCRIKIGKKGIDMRISTLPTVFGEKVVIRLLDKSGLLSMEELGFEPEDREKFKEILKRPYGIILLTGPTGSGKTTTLYSGLSYINSPHKNLVTVEDPVEYELKGINQTQVKPQIGLTFAKSLRHILRQDPDIIMIGEIRDLETAQIAVQASLTGHLVLSTLHTNDAVSVISRLSYMGIEPYLIAATLDLVIAQRLVRRICPACKEEDVLSEEIVKRFNLSLPSQAKVYKGKGCPECENSGYHGRIALYEIFELDREIKKMILERKDEISLQKESIKKGMRTLRARGLEKVIQGVTTLEEVLGTTFQEV